MIKRDDALVLILAGGVGSRLNILVQDRAKPAVPFGGIYRIIDFALSNIMNSGLSRVGVLTQYKPLSLMRHLAAEESWDFTGRDRGITILPPRTGEKDSDWYHGTADAVRKNIDFLEDNPAKEVIILSGDHIYHMDFNAMIAFHRSKSADVSIGMMVVPRSQIHHFGAGVIDFDNRIIEWEEKPKEPKTNLASMGIYVFDYDYLLESLQKDVKEMDFGNDILPRAIDQDNVYAYPFYGYWRDVGTIQAYWQANMDVVHRNGISPQSWEIITSVVGSGKYGDHPPIRFGSHCEVDTALICAGSKIFGKVYNSVLSPGVIVEEGAIVERSIIFEDCIIRKGARVDLAILDKKVEVGAGAIVGHGTNYSIANKHKPSHLHAGITILGRRAVIPENYSIGRNCAINSGAPASVYPGNCLEDGESLFF